MENRGAHYAPFSVSYFVKPTEYDMFALYGDKRVFHSKNLYFVEFSPKGYSKWYNELW